MEVVLKLQKRSPTILPKRSSCTLSPTRQASDNDITLSHSLSKKMKVMFVHSRNSLKSVPNTWTSTREYFQLLTTWKAHHLDHSPNLEDGSLEIEKISLKVDCEKGLTCRQANLAQLHMKLRGKSKKHTFCCCQMIRVNLKAYHLVALHWIDKKEMAKTRSRTSTKTQPSSLPTRYTWIGCIEATVSLTDRTES